MHYWSNAVGKLVSAAVMLALLVCPLAFGQSSAASLSGTVQDASKAVLPGATVSAVNNGTGVKTTAVSNEAGVYNFASLQPGTYKVSAEMSGFQTSTMTDVQLGVGVQLRLNFELPVAGVSTQVEVTTSAQDILLESSSSTGAVLQEKAVTALPNVGNDMMSLINVMGGVVRQTDTLFGNSSQTFAGVPAGNVNLSRDGITVNDVRFQSGVVSPGRINPEMVSEFRMVLSPVDAEMGRGAAQVQVLTRSGTNAYHGSGIWSIMNTALDANEWANNRTTPVTTPNWRNVNNYTASLGGPIKKNKTFFFATWDHQIVRQRSIVRTPVLTPCARKGIYRYFPGWINGNTQTAINRTNGTQTRPVVNEDGTPLTPSDNRDGSAYTGSLQWQSVLGQLTPEANAQIAADPINCSQFNFAASNAGVIPGSNWDPFRKGYDASGYIERFTKLMPEPNEYYVGDGLNVANHRWVRTIKGNDTVFGTGMDNGRKSITVKLDHNLNTAHRLSGTYSFERSVASAAEASWPNVGLSGVTDRKPQTFTTNFTSTLRPTLLNEFRMGLAYNESHNIESVSNPDTGDQMKALLQELMSTKDWPKWQGLPVVIGPGSGATSFVPDNWSIGFATGISNPYGSRGNFESTWGDKDTRWTVADTMTWTRGSHSFKGGAELRLTRSQQDSNGWAQFSRSSNTFPYVQGGNTVNSQPSGIGTKWTGMVGNDLGNFSSGTYSQAYNLMSYMAGSVGVIRQFYFVNSASEKTWSDPTQGDLVRLIDLRQKELSFFFKDDWKVNPSLTLNLGVRYDYYGVPWEGSGMTNGLIGGSQMLFGGSGGDFSNWHPQDPTFNPNSLTAQQFIGPNSPNSSLRLFNKDLNNFGPAIGFAWQLPWFGKGKTTLRGGYQASYMPITTLDPNTGFGLVISNVPGTIFPHEYSGDTLNAKYLDLTMLKDLIPTAQFMDPSIQPLQLRPVTDRSQNISVYDPNLRNPYIQSLTLALTRQIGSSLTVDARYIGTLSRKLTASQNLNAVNFINNGLAEAFDIARAGGESALLDQLIRPNSLQANTPSGAAQLRASSQTRTALATGNYASLANTLATTNGLVPTAPGTRGNLLRNSGTSENFIYTNPQFSQANWIGNRNNTNYHSLQTQVTLRPTHGLNFQTSYTWSRNLGIGSITDVHDRAADYGLLSTHRSHTLTTHGTYRLPLGADGLLFRGSSAPVRRIVEGWEMSWIASVASGQPTSVTTVDSMWGGTGVDLVRPDLFDTKDGKVTWEPGAFSGRYFGDKYVQVTDPQCATVHSSLQSVCALSLHGLALASDPSVVVFQHAQPGVRGNFKPNSLTGPGQWTFDMAMSKNIAIREGTSLSIRIDAQNVFNHPFPSGGAPTTNDSRNYSVSNPTFDLNSTNPFGFIGYKGGHRVFSAKLRLSF
jgi:hypothetical protein